MCGIVGFLNSNRNPDEYPEAICDMLSMIRHRGPDEMGYFFDNYVALGTARLNVIDLALGQQPMSDSSGRYWITYNGETYNYLELRNELEVLGHRFLTNSDTEVVLNAYIEWGKKAFAKLNGGFAFAIYDSVTHNLVLVRDRYGERPLFYAKREKELVFASEIKSFIGYRNLDLKFNVEDLRSTYTIWTPLPNRTVYEGIYQVPPGSYVFVSENGDFNIEQYYSLNFLKEKSINDEMEAAKFVKEALSESVRLRLRSDVEVGTYLSGGLDSSITTLLATKHSRRPVKTFSITFEDPAFDESQYQRELSGLLGTVHHSLQISNKEIMESFIDALWYAEIPTFRTAFVPMYLLSKLVKDQGIKVVLTGEGSDEFFLGYDFYKETLLRQSWDILTIDQKKERLQCLNPFEKFFHENALKIMALYERYTKEQIPGLFSHEIRFNNSSFASRLLSMQGDNLNLIKNFIENYKDEFNPLSVLEKTQWLDCKTLLAGYLLSTQGDRMSFSHGVETRLPFLDSNVVKLAGELPIDLRLKNEMEEKHILKQAFKDELPNSIINKPKHPYRAPDASAFLHDQPPDYMDVILSLHELKKIDFINADFVTKLIDKLKITPKSQISQRENQAFIFLLSTGLLYRHFIKSPMHMPSGVSIKDLLKKTIDGRKIDKKVLA